MENASSVTLNGQQILLRNVNRIFLGGFFYLGGGGGGEGTLAKKRFCLSSSRHLFVSTGCVF